MTDWASVPVFGETIAATPGGVRPSAYGIINDADRRIAVVRAPQGVFLPGGGSDVDEAPESTIVREVREECGLVVTVGRWRRAAIQRAFSRAEQAHFEKRSIFCNATVTGSRGEPTEDDHVLEWMTSAEAASLLTDESHRWAVREWHGLWEE